MGLTAWVMAGCAVAVVGERWGVAWARPVGKVAASLGMVAAGVASGVPWLALVALVAHLAGDVLLLSHRKALFVAGMLAFLVGHVAYAGAFLASGVGAVATLLAGGALVACVAPVWRWLAPHTGRLRRPVAAYVAALAMMVALAWGTGRPGLGVSATAFLLSDLLVARNRFVAPGWGNRAVGLPLYYAAQLGLIVGLASSPG
jgi:uncharacterized membrane protein YhhN